MTWYQTLRDGADLYVQFKEAAERHQVLNLGLPFQVGWWAPSRLALPKPRFRWMWGHAWRSL